MTVDEREHAAPVTRSTPSLAYGYTNGSGKDLRGDSVTAPSGTQVDYAYGASDSLDQVLNRVASLKIHGDTPNLGDYTWAGFGRLVTLKYPVPNAELSYLTAGAFNGDAGDPMTGYDRFGRTTRMPWKNGGTVLADIAYGYDRASRRTWRQDLTPAAAAAFDRAYGYDALGQVKSADRGTLNTNRSAIGGIPQEAEAWQYDEQGNWLAYDKAEDGASVIDQSRRSNVSNQIVTIDGSNEGVAYDKNGNMIRIPTGDALTGAPRKLVWNAWDQLVEVRVESSNALLQRNAYDGLFRRTTRTFPATPSGETVIHQYYNERWKPIEERKDAATTALNVYYWGARDGHRDDLIRRDRDTNGDGSLDERLYALMDYYNGTSIVNPAGAVQERYEYSAFGVRAVMAPDFSPRTASDFAWDFGFQGQFLDAEIGYLNYGYRYYNPMLGRWVNRDPIGEKGGVNLYLFAQNNGIKLIDFLGNAPQLPVVPSGGFDAQNPIPLIGDGFQYDTRGNLIKDGVYVSPGPGSSDPCERLIVVGHFTGTNGLQDKTKDENVLRSKCGFVGCGANLINNNLPNPIPGMPVNRDSVEDHPLNGYRAFGKSYDYEYSDYTTSESILYKIEAAKQAAMADICGDKCCKSGKIIVQCQSRLISDGHWWGPDISGLCTTYSVSCSTD